MRQSNLLIYSMGRVGSVSVRKALDSAGVKSIHVHHLLNKNNEPGFGGPRWNEIEKQIDKNRPIQIITLIRDPMYRSLSSFMLQKRKEDLSTWSIDKARKTFLAENRMYYTLKWFDYELSKFLEMDSLSYLRSTDFKRKKWHRFTRFNKEVLVLRTSHLDYRNVELSQFTKRSIEIKRHNVSANRPGYSEQYARIIEGLTFCKDFIDDVYSSKLVVAAFTEKEIEEMKENWL